MTHLTYFVLRDMCKFIARSAHWLWQHSNLPGNPVAAVLYLAGIALSLLGLTLWWFDAKTWPRVVMLAVLLWFNHFAGLYVKKIIDRNLPDEESISFASHTRKTKPPINAPDDPRHNPENQRSFRDANTRQTARNPDVRKSHWTP